MTDTKASVRGIIDKLTVQTPSILSEKVFNIAAELGIGDLLVQDSLNQLIDENFITMPMAGVVKRV